MENKIIATIPFYEFQIPKDWQLTRLGSICQIKGRIGYRGYTVQDIVSEGDGAITISPSNFKNGKLDYENSTYISWFKYEESPEIQLKNNDILLVKTGSTYGKSALVSHLDIKATINPQIVVIKDVKCDGSFLSYIIADSIFQKQIRKVVVGGAIPTLSQQNILNFKIPLPAISEQRAIAKVLGSMDKAINTNNHLIAQKELHKKWLMQNLLTGKKRLNGFNGEWQEYHLGEMFEERNERNTDELPLLSIGQKGVYPQEDSIKKDTSNADKSKYKKICVGDIGYNTMRMWQGRSALSTLEGIVSPAYTILKPRKTADALFFSYVFKTPKMVNLFWRNSQGLVGDTLNCKYKDLYIVKATLPLKDEQTAIAKILQAADKEISLLKAKSDKLKEQKKGMMQILLTGKKRLKL